MDGKVARPFGLTMMKVMEAIACRRSAFLYTWLGRKETAGPAVKSFSELFIGPTTKFLVKCEIDACGHVNYAGGI